MARTLLLVSLLAATSQAATLTGDFPPGTTVGFSAVHAESDRGVGFHLRVPPGLENQVDPSSVSMMIEADQGMVAVDSWFLHSFDQGNLTVFFFRGDPTPFTFDTLRVSGRDFGQTTLDVSLNNPTAGTFNVETTPRVFYAVPEPASLCLLLATLAVGAFRTRYTF